MKRIFDGVGLIIAGVSIRYLLTDGKSTRKK